MQEYMRGKPASELLGVHQRTLYMWEKKGLIETIRTDSNMRLYNVKKYLEDKCKNETCSNPQQLDNIKGKLKIAYVRVSSQKQSDDLKRQKKLIKELYPNHLVIEDIGSGINFNKRGIKKIIDLAIEGKIKEVVVLHKDRLARIGYELIENLIEKYSKGKIIIVSKKDKDSPEEELARDVLEIMNVFVARMNGLRKYKSKN